MSRRSKAGDLATMRERVLYTKSGNIEVGSKAWFAWLENNPTFYVSYIFNKKCEVSIRAEVRHGTRHWYAYKRVQGTLYKRYVGQRPTYADVIEVMERMVGTDLFIPKRPPMRFFDSNL